MKENKYVYYTLNYLGRGAMMRKRNIGKNKVGSTLTK